MTQWFIVGNDSMRWGTLDEAFTEVANKDDDVKIDGHSVSIISKSDKYLSRPTWMLKFLHGMIDMYMDKKIVGGEAEGILLSQKGIWAVVHFLVNYGADYLKRGCQIVETCCDAPDKCIRASTGRSSNNLIELMEDVAEMYLNSEYDIVSAQSWKSATFREIEQLCTLFVVHGPCFKKFYCRCVYCIVAGRSPIRWRKCVASHRNDVSNDCASLSSPPDVVVAAAAAV